MNSNYKKVPHIVGQDGTRFLIRTKVELKMYDMLEVLKSPQKESVAYSVMVVDQKAADVFEVDVIGSSGAGVKFHKFFVRTDVKRTTHSQIVTKEYFRVELVEEKPQSSGGEEPLVMKTLVIETWNGEGYSDSRAMVSSSTIDEAITSRMLDKIFEDQVIFDAMKTNRDRWFSYKPDFKSDNSGRAYVCPFESDIIGVAIMPETNSFEIVRSTERMEEFWEMAFKSDEFKAGEKMHGVCHHNVAPDGQSLILFDLTSNNSEFADKI